MNYWTISDPHLGHENVKKYADRPDGYELLILKNIRAAVKPGNVLICLGDVSFGNDDYWHNQLVYNTTGTKWLIRGNHDKKSMSWYLEHGWDFVAEQVLLEVYGKRVLLSHEPQPMLYRQGRGLAREEIWTPELAFDINVHGHCHNDDHRVKKLESYHRLVKMEHDYKPVTLRSIVEGNK